MLTNTAPDISLKPRVLIVDDSRIVRAALTQHIQGMFEFREAPDGEQAWETLLLDPNIQVLITDLTMPNLDGYGLLERIRSSKISRIRNMPVVVMSGSVEHTERERAKAAGATDVITKGIGTAQLLSRLDILTKLVSTQREYERGLEAAVHNPLLDSAIPLSSPFALQTQAEAMLTHAIGNSQNFMLLNLCIGFKDPVEGKTVPPASIIIGAGQLLQRAVRQSDSVAKTGEAEFTLATGSINSDSARNFAQRVCHAIANAHLTKGAPMALVASCGLVSLFEHMADQSAPAPTLNALWDIAHRRAVLGLHHRLTGVVSVEEESAFSQIRSRQSDPS